MATEEIGHRCVAEGSTVLAPVTTPHLLRFRLLKSTSKLCPLPQSTSFPPNYLRVSTAQLPYHLYLLSSWAGSLGLRATPTRPLTVAASRRIGQVVHAAGRVEMLSSAVWTVTISWMESKMIRKLVGNAQRRFSSLRQLVRRPGYVQHLLERFIWLEIALL